MTTRTVRRTAAEVGVHKNTAFRWRHRLLSSLAASDDAPLGRSVLIHETWFPHSEKGSRTLQRPPRRRSTGYRIDVRHAWVLIARDHSGRVASRLVGDDRPGVSDLRPLLSRLEPTTELLSSFGPWGATGLLAERTRRIYRHVDDRSPELRTVRRYLMALRRWLKRFRGVATRYLNNYLAWHRFFVILGGSRAMVTGPPLLLAGRFP